ncbi:MAG: hypothetical protein Q7K26_00220 [bacterium]|nr:hypothetical protein [bacterium]
MILDRVPERKEIETMKNHLVLIISALVLASGCSTLQTTVVQTSCDSWRLVANVRSFDLLPLALQKEVTKLKTLAESRNTHNATSRDGYLGEAVSRTLGPQLRKEVRAKASVDLNLEVFYRDPLTSRIVEDLGLLHIMGDLGTKVLPDDPRKWIAETVWPEKENFISPTVSGGARRIWLFGEEWKGDCAMNVYGIVP